MRLACLAAAVLTVAASAAQAVPSDFAAYPVVVSRTAHHAPDFVRAPQFRELRTSIRNGARRVNFAGHYALVMTGCGAGCRMVALVDLNSGRIGDFPLGGENNYLLDLQYRANSRLVRATWQTQDASPACVHEDLVLTGARFQRLPERRTPGECPPPR